ncbi:zinc-binding alcohol dehydrogenase [Paenibacillus psychroresistens]|uniref:Zinc-binding alcohol dehydrogenase n=1 Tax=Paenibacillus psychroresistens TaxID=1778678 RepID=A0A6B8RQS1_9BACL|nr:zinc-binding alcohol dehydrogenase [Paenibacillus psychroresistens]QGQ98349.1 zinc-binding alcohol dehydrogenase [Paenibacillus psychroresistens]
MPKQLIVIEPRKAGFKEYVDAAIQEDQVKVKVEYAAPKRGTELMDFRNETPNLVDAYMDEWKAYMPLKYKPERFGGWPLGNQWVGIITEVGTSVLDYRVGERVCGYGGIQETHVICAVDNYYLLKMPQDMSWKSALCFDPAQFALSAIRDARLRVGDRVAVIGLGAIGQLSAQLAKLAGASYVAVIDPIALRREIALRTGADAAFDPASQDVGLELKKATNKLGVDIIIETSASEQALQQSLRGLAYGGTIAYVGLARKFNGGLDLGREAHFNNAKIIFSRACSEPNSDYPRWDWRRIEETCWDFLCTGRLQCDEIIDPVVAFGQSVEGYEEYVDQHPDKSIKLGVTFV